MRTMNWITQRWPWKTAIWRVGTMCRRAIIQKMQSGLRRFWLPFLPPYLISLQQMSPSPAYIVPYEHQFLNEITPSLDTAQLWATTPAPDKPLKVGTVCLCSTKCICSWLSGLSAFMMLSKMKHQQTVLQWNTLDLVVSPMICTLHLTSKLAFLLHNVFQTGQYIM